MGMRWDAIRRERKSQAKCPLQLKKMENEKLE